MIRPADQLKRGWGVNPEMSKPHFAVIEPARVIVLDDGTEFAFRIGSEYEGAPVGRFRVSVTDSEFPEVMPEEIRKILRDATRARDPQRNATSCAATSSPIRASAASRE